MDAIETKREALRQAVSLDGMLATKTRSSYAPRSLCHVDVLAEVTDPSLNPHTVVGMVINAMRMTDPDYVTDYIRVGNVGSVQLCDGNDINAEEILKNAQTLFAEKVLTKDQFDRAVELVKTPNPRTHCAIQHMRKKQQLTWFPDEVERGYKFVPHTGKAMGFDHIVRSNDSIVRIHGLTLPTTEVTVLINFNPTNNGHLSDSYETKTYEHIKQLWGSGKNFKAFRRLVTLGWNGTGVAQKAAELDNDIQEWAAIAYLATKGGLSRHDFNILKTEHRIPVDRSEFLQTTRRFAAEKERALDAAVQPLVEQFALSH